MQDQEKREWTDPEVELMAGALRTLGYPEEKLEAIRRGVPQVREKRCRPGETILVEGDSPREVFVVKRGVAAVMKRKADGALKRVAELRPGDVFGEIGVLYKRRRTATVAAIGEVELWVISGSEFIWLMDASPGFRDRMEARAGQRRRALAAL